MNFAMQDKELDDYDAVCCCVGTYYQPNLPDVPGLLEFPGRQLHCHNFRRSDSFKGQRVLVVGASFSGLHPFHRLELNPGFFPPCTQLQVQLRYPRSLSLQVMKLRG